MAKITKAQLERATQRVNLASQLAKVLIFGIADGLTAPGILDAAGPEGRKVLREIWEESKLVVQRLITSPFAPSSADEFGASDVAVAAVRARDLVAAVDLLGQFVNRAQAAEDENALTGETLKLTDEQWVKVQARWEAQLGAVNQALAALP